MHATGEQATSSSNFILNKMIKRRKGTSNGGPHSGGHSSAVVVEATDDSTSKVRDASPSAVARKAVLFSAFLLICCLIGVLIVGDNGGSSGPNGSTSGGKRYVRKMRDQDASVLVSVAAAGLADVPPKTTKHHRKVRQKEDHATKEVAADFDESIRSIRDTFAKRYGGDDEAYKMLSRGIKTFGDESKRKLAVQHTAKRILRAAASDDPKFVASFGGYSVTVGRGNMFSQSFPFIMESVLKEPLKKLGVDLVVRNAAIGGIPSFPYGWCLSNFLGEDSDLVSWDYSMNEGNDATGLESYIRHALATMPKRPLVVILDNKRNRMDLIDKYVNLGTLIDPVAIVRGDNVVDKNLLSRKEEELPEGLTKWNEWGAPKGSPGQSSWHPKFREHEMMGWMLAVHLLDAVESAGKIMKEDPNWRQNNKVISSEGSVSEFKLPPPQTSPLDSEVKLLDGTETSKGSWQLNTVSCRTSFLPVVADAKTITSILVSGAAEDDGDATKSKDDSMYNTGWVIDVGKVERDTKRKVEKKGGMGYIDMKLALYGIPESGPVKFWLPYEGDKTLMSGGATYAKHYFDTIVVCEVNEKRGNKECQMDSDIKFTVGGTPSADTKKIKSIASYLKKEICVQIPVPEGAQITKRKDVEVSDSGLHGNIANEGNIDDIGMFLEAEVINKAVSRADGACSISHVVWEHARNV